MNFIVIDETVAKTRSQLKIERSSIKASLLQQKNKTYIDKLLEVESKLRALDRFGSSKTEYQKIQYLKLPKPKRYIKECIKLSRTVPGISFNRKTKLFRVQKTFSGKRVYGGQFDSFDDAVESLGVLISINQKHI